MTEDVKFLRATLIRLEDQGQPLHHARRDRELLDLMPAADLAGLWQERDLQLG